MRRVKVLQIYPDLRNEGIGHRERMYRLVSRRRINDEQYGYKLMQRQTNKARAGYQYRKIQAVDNFNIWKRTYSPL